MAINSIEKIFLKVNAMLKNTPDTTAYDRERRKDLMEILDIVLEEMKKRR